MTTETKRTYIPFCYLGKNGRCWSSNPTAYISVERFANDRELAWVHLDVRFCQVVNEDNKLELIMERRIGSTAGAIKREKLPDLYLGHGPQIKNIDHIYVDDFHSKIVAYHADGGIEQIVWDYEETHSVSELAFYMAKTGQFLVERALALLKTA